MDLDDEPPLGPDGDLVTDMVSKAVLPLLIRSFESGAYDPYSTPQTRKAIDLAEVISDLTGKDSRKYADLLKAILGVFRQHVLDLAAQVGASAAPGAVAPPAFDPTSRIALGRYVRRRLKLIRNLLLWKREAGRDVAEVLNRLVGEVLKPILDKQWDGGGKELAAAVSAGDGTVRRDADVRWPLWSVRMCALTLLSSCGKGRDQEDGKAVCFSSHACCTVKLTRALSRVVRTFIQGDG